MMNSLSIKRSSRLTCDAVRATIQDAIYDSTDGSLHGSGSDSIQDAIRGRAVGDVTTGWRPATCEFLLVELRGDAVGLSEWLVFVLEASTTGLTA